MQICVLADVHDNVWNLQKVIQQVDGKIDVAIFCGEMGAPFTAAILAQLNRPTYLCLGNNEHDAIFYGHTHQTNNEMIGKTLLLNPGPVCGLRDGRPVHASYALYETSTNSGQIVQLMTEEAKT